MPENATGNPVAGNTSQNTPPTQTGTPPQPAPQNASPQPAPDTSTEPLPQGMTRRPDGRVQVLSQSAFKRLKTESREKGRKEALSEFAKEAGFTSVEDLQKALKARKAAPAQDPTLRPNQEPQAQPNRQNERPDRRTVERWERERTQTQKQIEQLRVQHKETTAQAKSLQQALDAKDAEMQLYASATAAGIRQDPEYAIRLLTKHVEGLSDEETAKFDEAKFFAGLRETHPYLFGEVVRPATTGTGAGAAPAAPKPGDASQRDAQNNQVDVRKMNPEEYRKHLAARGFSVQV